MSRGAALNLAFKDCAPRSQGLPPAAVPALPSSPAGPGATVRWGSYRPRRTSAHTRVLYEAQGCLTVPQGSQAGSLLVIPSARQGPRHRAAEELSQSRTGFVYCECSYKNNKITIDKSASLSAHNNEIFPRNGVF